MLCVAYFFLCDAAYLLGSSRYLCHFGTYNATGTWNRGRRTRRGNVLLVLESWQNVQGISDTRNLRCQSFTLGILKIFYRFYSASARCSSSALNCALIELHQDLFFLSHFHFFKILFNLSVSHRGICDPSVT